MPGSREDFDRLYRNSYPRVFRPLVAILADPTNGSRQNDEVTYGLSFARAVDTEGAWAALDIRTGPFTITPGVRSDTYHADMPAAAPAQAGRSTAIGPTTLSSGAWMCIFSWPEPRCYAY